MSLEQAPCLTRLLTWGTLSAALSSALWLSAGDDNYPLPNWIDELLGSQSSGMSVAVGQGEVERVRAVAGRLPGLR
jgi:hypothetical protein